MSRFERFAQLVIRHRRAVLAVWLVASFAIVPFAPRLTDVTNSDEASFLPDSYESVKASRLAASAFPESAGATGILVFSRTDGAPMEKADHRAANRVAGQVAGSGIALVEGIRTGNRNQLSPDGRLQLAQVAFRGDSGDDAVMDAAGEVRDATSAALRGTALKAGLTGDAAIRLDDRSAHQTAEKTVGIATIALILLLLLATFRSPVAALLPILSIALVFLLAGSLIALAAEGFGFDVGLDLPPLLTVVLFGIGTDYILFTLFRYREELRKPGRSEKEALARATGKVGEVITFAAFVVIVAFSALGLSELGSLRAMAPGLVIGVALMWLAGLTLIPAVLSMLGPRVFWPSRRWERAPSNPFYRRVGGLIGRGPVAVALASGGFLLLLATGAPFFQADYNGISQLPKDAEARESYEQMQRSMPAGAMAPVQVYLTGQQRLDRGRVGRLFRQHSRPPGVATAMPPVYSADGRTARVDLLLRGNPYSNQSLELVEGPIRQTAHRSGLAERTLVGGQTAANADIRSATNRDYAVVFPVAALMIAALLAWLLRSLVAPLYLLGAVMLGFAATLGVSVALFLGVSGEPGLKSILPVIVYLFVVAVGTDYSILIASRMREEALAGCSPRQAAARGVEHAGPAVAAAGIILAGSFTSLILTGIASLMQIGFAVSSGILIVSLVMATLLVPALTALAGRRAWWPGLRRRGGGGAGGDPGGLDDARHPVPVADGAGEATAKSGYRRPDGS